MQIPLDARNLLVVIHDLKNILNTMGLCRRILAESMPAGQPAVDEDFEVLGRCIDQMNEALMLLSRFAHLYDRDRAPASLPFDPRTIVRDLVFECSERRGRSGQPPVRPIEVDVGPGCPQVVELPAEPVRLALEQALSNVITAAGGERVRVRLDGQADRWIVRLSSDHAPGADFEPTTLKPDVVEVIEGDADRRFGLDLALVARVSELLGGRAALEREGEGTAVVLDWPVQLKDPA